MNSLISNIGAGARISALAAFAVTVGVGGASAATTCGDVLAWPGTIAASAICNSTAPNDVNVCGFANASQADIQSTCCDISPPAGESSCIQGACTAQNTNRLLAANVTCYTQ